MVDVAKTSGKGMSNYDDKFLDWSSLIEWFSSEGICAYNELEKYNCSKLMLSIPGDTNILWNFRQSSSSQFTVTSNQEHPVRP